MAGSLRDELVYWLPVDPPSLREKPVSRRELARLSLGLQLVRLLLPLPLPLPNCISARVLSIQVYQNSALVRALLDGLDAKFQASHRLSVRDLRVLAKTVSHDVLACPPVGNGDGSSLPPPTPLWWRYPASARARVPSLVCVFCPGATVYRAGMRGSYRAKSWGDAVRLAAASDLIWLGFGPSRGVRWVRVIPRMDRCATTKWSSPGRGVARVLRALA